LVIFRIISCIIGYFYADVSISRVIGGLESAECVVIGCGVLHGTYYVHCLSVSLPSQCGQRWHLSSTAMLSTESWAHRSRVSVTLLTWQRTTFSRN